MAEPSVFTMPSVLAELLQLFAPDDRAHLVIQQDRFPAGQAPVVHRRNSGERRDEQPGQRNRRRIDQKCQGHHRVPE